MKRKTVPILLLLIPLLSAAMVSVQNLQATTIIVTNTNDSGPGSLRQALADANNGDAINFDSSLNGGTITLFGGELVVNKSLTINGPGANHLTVSGDGASRVFHVTGGFTVTIAGLTITRGMIIESGGGGIYNERSTLTVSNCTLSGNSAGPAGGGGIYNDGSGGDATLSVLDSTLDGNLTSSGGPGGGIYSNGGRSGSATLSVLNSTLQKNVVFAIIRGESGHGGGIYNGDFRATLSVRNSTLSGNYVLGKGFGGGISNKGRLSVLNSTLEFNRALFGGGIESYAPAELGSTIFDRSPILGNPGGEMRSIGYNLSSDDGGRILRPGGRYHDQINTNPLLGPLQNNGGPTSTHALLPGSPAINTGDPNFAPPPFYDQRGAGFSRVVNGRIDIGSFEVQL
jgi:hypothetical protein